ncbi:hypothetical protein UVI_02054360 [Ustilaginoidea virens]|uniref:MMS19 nucleotide excision repair protein n=1 Tax=Ustilaginoidea virens TaxID=1159556 RepID=A0A1B5L766_USTVR|nr:hypothetical protein UVI_02054360 [Ustilaginoidea virens]
MADFRQLAVEFVLQDDKAESARIALRAAKVNLLVAFFGSMFDVDHKAGILASANALSRIIAMKSFDPKSGHGIIEKISKLNDDFPRQLPQSRLAVYELMRSLIQNPAVVKDLRLRDGDDAPFMKGLVRLCGSERDPDCLMVWFDILRIFLSGYSPSAETLEEVYGAFKAYFPITLPRTAQSGVTPEELKLQLRKCFSSTHALASLTLPFLIGKLDQGDGVTVNVKVDILRTIKACLEEYQHSVESIAPYTNRIWTSLKYEVRNGEIEDSIWATLEVLKTLATRLTGDDLRDYTLTVTRDCVADLATPMYTTSAGRLLVGVLSASSTTFVLMVAPAVTHVKENLRHPKSPTHTLNLLKILRIILETRLLLTNEEMSEPDTGDFAAVDSIFTTLYEDVYKAPLASASKPDALDEDFRLSAEAVQGVGALIGQRKMRSLSAEAVSGQHLGLLISGSTCFEICEAMFAIATQSWHDEARRSGSDDLGNEATKALQRSIRAFPQGFHPLVVKGMSSLRHSIANLDRQSLETIQSLGPFLAYVGCSAVSDNAAETMKRFLELVHAFAAELFVAIGNKTSPKIWCFLVVGIHTAARHFNDACLEKDAAADQGEGEPSLADIGIKYPEIAALGSPGEVSSTAMPPSFGSIAEARSDALLICFHIAGLFYKQATRKGPVSSQLVLSDDFTASEPEYERQYLYLLSELAGFAVHEMTESQQALLEVEKPALNLFREMEVNTSATSWHWLTNSPLNVLSLGILGALRPSRVAKLYDMGVAQQIIFEDAPTESDSSPARRAILAVLANKYSIETLDSVMTDLERSLDDALRNLHTSDSPTHSLGLSLSLFALLGGLLRRHSGSRVQRILQILQTAPNNAAFGSRLARGLETIVAPQKLLTKESFAVVRLLWLQRVYIGLIKPMLEVAVGNDSTITDAPIRANFSIAVLLMIKHVGFSVWEEDAAKILRIAIVVAQNLGTGLYVLVALQAVKSILVESSDKVEAHIPGLIKICTSVFTGRTASFDGRPERLPTDAADVTDSLEVQAGCGKLALEIVGGLPRMFEPRHLLAYEPQVQRDLSTACGHKVRELRSTARLARGAWADVK